MVGEPFMSMAATWTGCSIWMRFMNCARNEREQNMMAFQNHGQIFYRSFKEIQPNMELLVWYGEQYAKEMGISTGFKQGMLSL